MGNELSGSNQDASTNDQCFGSFPKEPPHGSEGSLDVVRPAAAAGQGRLSTHDPKFRSICQEYFVLFDQDHDGHLREKESHELVGAVCEVWQLPTPTACLISSAFEQHSTAAGLSQSNLHAFADDLVAASGHARSRAATLPIMEDATAARGRRASRQLLHAPLPTGEKSLKDMGACGVAALVWEVSGLVGGAGVLGAEEQLCCFVVVHRVGRLLPRRCARSTAVAMRSASGAAGSPPRWRFDEELIFDDPNLLSRHGELWCEVVVRRCNGALARVLAVAEGVPVPTNGPCAVELLDPSTRYKQGEVRLSIGWPCSGPLVKFIAADILRHVQEGRWVEAREGLRVNGADAMELIAGAADETGRTLLMWAARSEDGTALLLDLLACQPAIMLHAVDAYGATAVHYAALTGSVESLAALLGSGASANVAAAGLAGATPLMLAAFRVSPDHAKLLLGHAARAEVLDDQLLPAAAWAVGCPDTLLHAGARQRWVSQASKRSSARGEGIHYEWTPEHKDLLFVLCEALWNASPPEYDAATLPQASKGSSGTVQGNRRWTAIVERAAEGAQPVLQWIFRDFLQVHCGSVCSYKCLLRRLFEEAIARKSEPLAVQLVQELRATEAWAGGPADTSSQAFSRHVVFEAAVDASMPRLACKLLLEAEGPCLGHAYVAVRALQLATKCSHSELSRAVLRRLPLELPRDAWEEPAVLSGLSLASCPVCLQPLCHRPVMLCQTAPTPGEPLKPACTHLVCNECSGRLSNRCPLCRTDFAEVAPLPDPGEDPMAWFTFAAKPHGEVHAHGEGGGQGAPASELPALALNRVDLLQVLPATVPVEPRLLTEALNTGLWKEWDADGDGVISQEDFFEPRAGLLRWLLVHLRELREAGGEAADDSSRTGSNEDCSRGGSSPSRASVPKDGSSLAVDPSIVSDWPEWFARAHAWTKAAAALPGADAKASGSESEPPGLTKGVVLRELLRITGMSSLDKAQVDLFRSWILEHWDQWTDQDSKFIGYQAFVKAGGVAEALLERAAVVRVRTSVKQLNASLAQPTIQVDAMAQIARYATRRASHGSSSLFNLIIDDGTHCMHEDKEENESTNPTTPKTPIATAMPLVQGPELAKVLYAEAFPSVLCVLEKKPDQPQAVMWACRALISLALGCSSVLPGITKKLDPTGAHWPTLVRAALEDTELRKRFDGNAGAEGLSDAAAAAVARAAAALSLAPGVAAADAKAVRGAMRTAVVCLLLLAESPAGALQSLLEELPKLDAEKATPAARALASIAATILSCNLLGIAKEFEKWSVPLWVDPPLWAGPPCALPASSVRVGQDAEVCCHGGWMAGRVVRAPVAEPASPRDECWIVNCEGDTRIFSRHVWSLGWKQEAAAELARLRRTFWAHLTNADSASSIAAARSLRSKSLSTGLLEGVILGGLLPRAIAFGEKPSGPVLRGSGPPTMTVKIGDSVKLAVSVERAKALQTQRYGDWSEQMSFCLDSPGRVVETLTGPPRAVISHGALGTFLWNPLVVTSSDTTTEPLPFEENHGMLVVGDEVLICADQGRAVPLQTGHGGWSTRMGHCLGRYGRIAGFNNRGDVRVDTPGFGAFLWNPEAIEPVGSGAADVLCSHAMRKLDDEGAAIWLLLHLAAPSVEPMESTACSADKQDEPAEMHGREAMVCEVLKVLARAAQAQQECPPKLRAFGCLALVAAAADIRKALRNANAETEVEASLHELEVRLPACASEEVLKALRASPAMAWPAKDSGGISFAEVVHGHVDISKAVSAWLLAFFASRRRRMLLSGK
eukprot:TRINITY_DN69301_c0_g3_i1.p1 TRINITY_DN69301_c0_g3~~TRINITY_DN69301_c0_g3_i1.p1  ORF type:complete len:1782 (+),score=318.13 TRINITY_DN69301_c0_g3_i1:81-5426(+)